MNGYIKVPVKVVSAIKIHSQKTVSEGKKMAVQEKGGSNYPHMLLQYLQIGSKTRPVQQ